VFLQNACGNPTYVNQTNLNGKLRKKLGGGQAKIWGSHGPSSPPLESPLFEGGDKLTAHESLQPQTTIFTQTEKQLVQLEL